MSLHASDWAAVLEELKKDLPWLLSWWHKAKLGDFESSQPPSVNAVDLPALKEAESLNAEKG